MIALASVNEAEKASAAEYSAGVKPILQQYGGKPLARHTIQEQAVGEHKANVLLEVEFDSPAAIHQFLQSTEYQTLIPLREAGFTSMQIYVANV